MSQQPRAAVLGSPISHSLSPTLHRAAYRELGLDWRYDAIDVTEDSLAAFVVNLDSQWRGLSLTMPLKRGVIRLCTSVTEVAAQVNAVNTVVLGQDGSRAGHNTDVPGMVAAVAEAVDPTSLRSIGILGGGATAASAVAAAAAMDLPALAAVRSQARADELAGVARATGARLDTIDWADAATVLQADLVVSTTPAGAADALAERLPTRPTLLLDVVYAPWPTALARAWDARAGTVLGGLDLLVHQAVLQVELMTGRRPSVATLRAAGESALAGRDPADS